LQRGRLEKIRTREPQCELHLPMPRNPRLLAVCEALLADPARRDALDRRAENGGREQPHLGPPVHKRTRRWQSASGPNLP